MVKVVNKLGTLIKNNYEIVYSKCPCYRQICKFNRKKLKFREIMQNSDEKRVKFRRKSIQIKCEILINKKYFNFNLNTDFLILRFLKSL